MHLSGEQSPKESARAAIQRASCHTWLETRGEGDWEKEVSHAVISPKEGSRAVLMQSASSATSEFTQRCLGEKIDYCGLQIQARRGLLIKNWDSNLTD